MTNPLHDLKRRTRQALSLARQSVLAEAAATVLAHGPQGIIVTHLAKRHDVAPLTVRRWLAASGFALDHLTRGRPSFAKLDAVAPVSDDRTAELPEGDV